MSKVLDPEKELRFTRSSQAVLFALLGAILFTIGVILIVTYQTADLYKWEEKPFSLWILFLPWLPVIGFIWLSLHCVKHPYLILSPIGVEIFPLWKPSQNFNLIEWGRIKIIEFAGKKMTLHYNEEKKAGVVLTLSPLNKKSRMLLQRAMEGVMDQQK